MSGCEIRQSLLFLLRSWLLGGRGGSEPHQSSRLQIDDDGIPTDDALIIGSFENEGKGLGVGFDGEISEINDGVDLQHVIADLGSGGSVLALGSCRGESTASGDDVGSLLAVCGSDGAGEAFIKMGVPGENGIGPQAGRLATCVDVFADSDGTAVPGVGRQWWVVDGEYHGPLVRGTIRLEARQLIL